MSTSDIRALYYALGARDAIASLTRSGMPHIPSRRRDAGVDPDGFVLYYGHALRRDPGISLSEAFEDYRNLALTS